MGMISLRPLEPGIRFADAVTLEAMECVVPEQEIEAVLDDTGTRAQCKRKILAWMTVLLVIAMNLFTEKSIEQVLAQMVQGLRFTWLELDYRLPGKGSICEARYRLGPKPVVDLFYLSLCTKTRTTKGIR